MYRQLTPPREKHTIGVHRSRRSSDLRNRASPVWRNMDLLCDGQVKGERPVQAKAPDADSDINKLVTMRGVDRPQSGRPEA